VARDVDLGARHFGSDADGQAWRRLAEFHRAIEPRLLETLLEPFPAVGPALRLGVWNLVRVASMFAKSGRRLSRGLFRSEAARRVLPSLALHVDVGPDDWFGAALGYVLGLTASTGGYAVPRGGAQSITNALVTLLERSGGRLRLGSRVTRIVAHGNRATGVVLENGEQIRATRAVLADTSAPSLLLNLLDSDRVPARLRRKMGKFPLGFGTFKLDLALSGAVPWSVP
jgi:phytoene dehydrogenase-like protein